METYHFQKISHHYEGKLDLKEALKVRNKKEGATLYIVDDFIQSEFIRIQFMKHYIKLIQLLHFYLDSDDDTGVAYQEMLNEIERFRRMIQNKKRFLLEQEMIEIEQELKFYEQYARSKLVILEKEAYKIEHDNRRSK